jgi:hypothetical protein
VCCTLENELEHEVILMHIGSRNTGFPGERIGSVKAYFAHAYDFYICTRYSEYTLHLFQF